MAENKKQTTAADLPPISKLINLVEYQDNAVVSKTLIDTKMETVTVFAFAAGQGLSEHTCARSKQCSRSLGRRGQMSLSPINPSI